MSRPSIADCERLIYTVRSLIKLNATVTSRLPAGTAIKRQVDFIVFMERYLTCIGKTL
jgi:hypothetical protein